MWSDLDPASSPQVPPPSRISYAGHRAAGPGGSTGWSEQKRADASRDLVVGAGIQDMAQASETESGRETAIQAAPPQPELQEWQQRTLAEFEGHQIRWLPVTQPRGIKDLKPWSLKFDNAYRLFPKEQKPLDHRFRPDFPGGAGRPPPKDAPGPSRGAGATAGGGPSVLVRALPAEELRAYCALLAGKAAVLAQQRSLDERVRLLQDQLDAVRGDLGGHPPPPRPAWPPGTCPPNKLPFPPLLI
ncbi:hypothetical protein CB1_000434009 [Camelus ferus]|nr:hypothetical protein CB1_000434009 [Camelus ferus]